ncbi:YncE family protein [Prevotella sp. KH2C16]|uniref:YncE family protein n=1 Tax=Prevotella sp. KH2C16 TaxID=1855325 RepID=UPI0008E2D22F|nr:DUF5074 domain-containing protein [Prevotella sp. KH2C16]SFG20497.1 hypothetical protein SAMN05216383_10721 [Prevotella sp. KH2C16]
MKKSFSSILCLLLGLAVFTACHDDDNYLPDREYKVVSDGVFILNEGSYYSQINGTLDYLDYSADHVKRGVFASANGRSLGGTPNNAVLVDSTLYIACADEGRVEMIHSRTFKSLGYVTIESPRELATDGEHVYVSSYTGKVSMINAENRMLEKTSEVVGSHLEGIAVLGDYVYVANSTDATKQYTDPGYYLKSVCRLNKKTLTKVADITVGLNPTQLLTDGRYVYVVCMGNYKDIKAHVEAIRSTDLQVEKLFEATMMAYDMGGNIIYANAPYGGTPTYGVYSVSNGKAQTWTPSEAPQFPYSIAVDPISNDVYVSSLSPNPDYPSSASYDTDGILYRYNSWGSLKKKYTIGVSPGTIVFNDHVEVIEKP